MLAHEAEHVVELGRLHQLTVDTYGVQHAGPPTPPISTFFGLLSLRLGLEEGWGGLEVRDAHRYLAGLVRQWPSFDPPARRPDVTVYDVAGAGGPEEHAAAVARWAAATWDAWSARHPKIRRVVAAWLPADARSRIRAGREVAQLLHRRSRNRSPARNVSPA